MNDAYSEALKEAFAVAPVDKVIFHTLEIRQEGVQASVYMVQAREGITALDEDGNEIDFEPVGFQFSMPASNEEGFRSLNIVVDNIGRRASDFIQAALAQEVEVEVIYRPYLSDNLGQPHMNPPLLLFLKDADINSMQVSGRATFMDIVNKKFPNELYTRARFPGLGG